MAKNRKKRGPVAPAPPKEPPPPPVPVVKRGPTPKKVKVKRPKYVRPPRATPKPKPTAAEPAGSKTVTYAAITLTSSVAKSIPKPGVDLTERAIPGRM